MFSNCFIAWASTDSIWVQTRTSALPSVLIVFMGIPSRQRYGHKAMRVSTVDRLLKYISRSLRSRIATATLEVLGLPLYPAHAPCMQPTLTDPSLQTALLLLRVLPRQRVLLSSAHEISTHFTQSFDSSLGSVENSHPHRHTRKQRPGVVFVRIKRCEPSSAAIGNSSEALS